MKMVILLLTALTAAVCMFTSCGDNDSTPGVNFDDDPYVTAEMKAEIIEGLADEALCNMGDRDMNISGQYIICSDKSKNYGLPSDFDLDYFYDDMKTSYKELYGGNYKKDIAPVEYFVVYIDQLHNAYCVCADNGYLGTYPADSLLITGEAYAAGSQKYAAMDENEEYTFDELYDMCLELIR